MMKAAVVESWERVEGGCQRSLQLAWFGQLPQRHVFERGEGVIYRFCHQVWTAASTSRFWEGGGGSTTDFVTRLEVPSDFFPSTSKEKWRTGRRSPEGDGGAERGTFIFEQEDLISVTGVSSWWGYFAQCGGTPLIMAGIKIWECKLESKSDSVRQGEGYCFKQEESNLITFTFTCSFLYLCLHVFASVLDKGLVKFEKYSPLQ